MNQDIKRKFPLATAAIERVLNFGHGKHLETWHTKPVLTHVSHARAHSEKPFWIDEETVEYSVTHAAARLLMAVELMERQRVNHNG